jgi:hypothetical protein
MPRNITPLYYLVIQININLKVAILFLNNINIKRLYINYNKEEALFNI